MSGYPPGSSGSYRRLPALAVPDRNLAGPVLFENGQDLRGLDHPETSTSLNRRRRPEDSGWAPRRHGNVRFAYSKQSSAEWRASPKTDQTKSSISPTDADGSIERRPPPGETEVELRAVYVFHHLLYFISAATPADAFRQKNNAGWPPYKREPTNRRTLALPRQLARIQALGDLDAVFYS